MARREVSGGSSKKAGKGGAGKAPEALDFADADAGHRLTRFGRFDADFDVAWVYEGDLRLGQKATGRDVLAAFGHKKRPEEHGLFVVTGDLAVEGSLDLDAGLDFSMGLAVLGSLTAKAVRLDATMLFVFGGARVDGAIFFESNDGTLSIAKKTDCPLVVCHEGDLNVSATGEIFDSSSADPVDEDEDEDDDDDDDDGFPFARATMTLADAKKKLVAEVMKGGTFSSRAAFERAAAGLPLLGKSPPKKPAPPAAPKAEKAPAAKGKPRPAAKRLRPYYRRPGDPHRAASTSHALPPCRPPGARSARPKRAPTSS